MPGCVRLLISGSLDVQAIIHAVNAGEVSRVIQKPVDGATLLSTLNDAIAMRQRLGREYINSQAEDLIRERKLLSECLQDNMIMLAFQPIISSSTHHIVAFEALLRSKHPVMSNPSVIIPAAERHDMINTLSELVIQKAAQKLKELPKECLLFINIHPLELSDPKALKNRLEPLLSMANRIVLEVTERSRIQDIETWESAIDLLKDLGFGIAIDDLGAGYSTLSALAELQPKYIKVDMSIVRDINNNRPKQRLVELLCKFAEATEAKLIAEGIETKAEALAVCSCGASMLQGYLYGKPEFHTPEQLFLYQ
jgi:EAL domain-containing protein (putative c-di-GMP-specific phosphodiesterase class I)